MNKKTTLRRSNLIVLLFFLSLSSFAQYTPSYINSNTPDLDGDTYLDYTDLDDDQDGITDLTEGCSNFDIENTLGPDNTTIPVGTSGPYNLFGTTVTYTLSSGIDIFETELLSLDHGLGIKARQDGAGVSEGDFTVTFSNPIQKLFFKLVDFDQNESWTVHVYDENNVSIPLTTGNTIDGLYMMGQQVELLSGQVFHDNTSGVGNIDPATDSVEFDVLNAVYFYFPTELVSKIEFHILHPEQGSLRFIGMQYCQVDTDGDGFTNEADNDSDDDSIPDLVEAGGTDSDGDGVVDSTTDVDGDGLVDIYDTYQSPWYTVSNTGDCTFPHVINFPVSTTDANFDIDLSFCITGDYDVNSGSPSKREQVDITMESYTVQTGVQPGTNSEYCTTITIDMNDWNAANDDGNIQITFTPNSNVSDSCLGDVSVYYNTTETASSSIPDYDSDSDGVKDRIDLDSDNDGIADNTEAIPTASYITPSGSDSDSDGIDNSYDVDSGFTGFPFADTDSDSIPDYLDSDSDGTEEADNIEGHDTNGDGVVDGSDSPNADTGLYTGIDSDGDGLDDGYDNDDATFNPTNSSLQPTSHPIFDGGSDRDWRSTKSTLTLDFDGTDDHIDYGDELDLTGSFSLEAWVLQEQNVANGTIISKGNIKSGNQKGYTLSLINSYPNLTWYNSGGILKVNLTSPYSISNNRWYHIAATYDGSTAKLYIDGILVGTDTSSGAPGDISESCIIGAAYDSDTPTTPKNYFDGYIDEVRVWNTALSTDQIHEMMNQEIEQNGSAVRGKIIPLDITGGLLWSNLEGYYDMNDDDADDKSGHARNGNPKNITTLQEQTAPLPYTTKAQGNWDDETVATPWTYGDSVWDAPNSIGIDGTTPINWNIVQTDHNVSIDTYEVTGRERNVLGLIVNSNKLTVDGDDSSETGNGLTISNYLKIDGKIDLEGVSQLIQSSGSMLDVASSGTIEQDQQGTRDLYTYNYWSLPVGETSIISNNTGYSLPNVFMDGTTPSTPASINFLTSGYNGAAGSPVSIADYWIWKYANLPGDDYSQWQHVRSTGNINAGEGFTMKGVADTGGVITQQQNYVIQGKPNNGDITLTLAAGNQYLVGNPYASAIDANEFIYDNISIADGGRNADNVINGALYFWDHFASSTHVLSEYQGGYATYTLIGGTAAISNDVRINNTGAVGTKIPERYIPVGQGFFVSAIVDAALTGLTTVDGGDILFKNSQRIFKKEAVTGTNSGSVFLRSSNTKSDAEAVDEDIDPRQKIRLMLDSPKGYHRQLLVGVDENASNNFDLGYDAALIEDNKEDMYWQFNNAKFIIQAVNNFDEQQVLPLGIKTNIEGLSTLKIDTLENIEDGMQIFIHDKELGLYHDLRANNYEVYLTTGEHHERFELTFSKPSASLSVDDFEVNSLQTYFSNEKKSIIVHNPMLEQIKTIEMVNMLGQSVYRFDNEISENYTELKTNPLSVGTYIIKAETTEGTISKKVLVQ